MQDRRVRLFFVTPDLMMEALGARTPGEPSYGVVVEGLPAGYEIAAVMYDFMRQAFAVCVQHESFEVSPLGCEIPSIEVVIRRIEGPGAK